MEGISNVPQDPIERQFHEGVAEPDDPSEFLLKILGRTKDDLYESYPVDQIPEGETLDTLRDKLPVRREQMQSAFVRIREISAEMVSVYRKVCARNGLNPGKISLYVVGGRTRLKPLQHSSDIDVVFTAQNQSESLEPNYSFKQGDSQELIQKKTALRKEFIKELEPILDRYGLLEKDSDGEVTGWFVEPKGYGVSDLQARKDWAEMARTSDSTRAAIRTHSE